MGFIMVYLCLLMTPQRSLGEDPPPSRDVSPRPSRWEAQRAMPRLRALETKGNCCRLQGLTELRSAVLGSYRYQEKHRKKHGGWKKSYTTLDGWNPVNNGINHPSTGAGFLSIHRMAFSLTHKPSGVHQQKRIFTIKKNDFHHQKTGFTQHIFSNGSSLGSRIDLSPWDISVT